MDGSSDADSSTDRRRIASCVDLGMFWRLKFNFVDFWAYLNPHAGASRPPQARNFKKARASRGCGGVVKGDFFVATWLGEGGEGSINKKQNEKADGSRPKPGWGKVAGLLAERQPTS